MCGWKVKRLVLIKHLSDLVFFKRLSRLKFPHDRFKTARVREARVFLVLCSGSLFSAKE